MAKPKAKITSVTEAAERIISEYLDDPDVALFIGASFLEVRLKTILRIYFEARGKNTEKLLDEKMTLKPLIRLAYALDVLTKSEHDDFLDLAKKRGDLGHDTTRWRIRNEKENDLYKRLSTRALEFIRLNGSGTKIRKRLLSMSRVAPPKIRKA